MSKRVLPKRPLPHDATTEPRVSKIRKSNALGRRPTQILDIFVCGEGESGELGLGAHIRDGKRPIGVKSPRLNDLAGEFGIVQIAVGGMHCAALTHDSRIVTWGVNDDGALGRSTEWNPSSEAMMDKDGDTDSSDDDDLGINPLESTPTAVPSDHFGSDTSNLVQVVATDCATFVLTSKGIVYGWGTFKSNNGTLGFSALGLSKGIKVQKVPTRVPGLKNIISLAAGANHVLALDSSSNVFSWGAGDNGVLGHKAYQARTARKRRSSLEPSLVFLPGIKANLVSCGLYHSFVIDNHGAVYTWGLNNYFQAGISPAAGQRTNFVDIPTRIQNLDPYDIYDIRGGFHHSIACCKNGQILVWGRCDDGQLGVSLTKVPSEFLLKDGSGRPECVTVPLLVADLSAVSVAAGIDNSVILTAAGQPYAWGYSQSYRTGLRTEDPVHKPTLITNSNISAQIFTFVGCGGQFLVLAGTKCSSNGVHHHS